MNTKNSQISPFFTAAVLGAICNRRIVQKDNGSRHIENVAKSFSKLSLVHSIAANTHSPRSYNLTQNIMGLLFYDQGVSYEVQQLLQHLSIASGKRTSERITDEVIKDFDHTVKNWKKLANDIVASKRNRAKLSQAFCGASFAYDNLGWKTEVQHYHSSQKKMKEGEAPKQLTGGFVNRTNIFGYEHRVGSLHLSDNPKTEASSFQLKDLETSEREKKKVEQLYIKRSTGNTHHLLS